MISKNNMTDTDDFDLLVIGAGSGGVRAARRAAALGARVAIIEQDRCGGTCVIRGCVPKKLLVLASHFRESFAQARGYGWSGLEAARFSWPDLISAKDREIDRLEGVYESLLASSGVELIRGRARLLSPHHVGVWPADGRSDPDSAPKTRLSARAVLIACGGEPQRPAGAVWQQAITSAEAFHLPTLPPRIAILGAGYIALEFAGIFNALGSATHLISRKPQLLRRFDHDLGTQIARGMRGRGVHLHLGRGLAEIARGGAGFLLTFEDGNRLEVETLMAAIGRRPATADLGLSAAGLSAQPDGSVATNALGQTAIPSIWAIGDVTGKAALTPVAIAQGAVVAQALFGASPPAAVALDLVASAIFSQPAAATIGLGEEEARRRYGAELRVTRSEFLPLHARLGGGEERSLVKLLTDGSGRIVGLHMVDEQAPEIIQGFAVALGLGAHKKDFDRTIALHPTIAEEFVTLPEQS